MAIVANAIHKVSDFFNKICCGLCVIALVAMVIMTGVQIVFRLFFDALSWSEEVTKYLLVWSTFLGASIVYKSGGHISVTLLQDHCPPLLRKLLTVLVHLICGAFCTVTVIYGFRYMGLQGRQLSAALRVPMRYMYMAIPVGCLVMDLHILDAIVRQFVKKDEGALSE